MARGRRCGGGRGAGAVCPERVRSFKGGTRSGRSAQHLRLPFQCASRSHPHTPPQRPAATRAVPHARAGMDGGARALTAADAKRLLEAHGAEPNSTILAIVKTWLVYFPDPCTAHRFLTALRAGPLSR